MLRAHLDTYPILEAFRSEDECPFCFAMRELERRSMEFVVGPSSSYMQRDTRALTDKAGFCARHLKGMYDYGNFLGDALILQTHQEKLWEEYQAKAAAYKPVRRGLFGIRKKEAGEEKAPEGPSEFSLWLRNRKKKCFLCSRVADSYDRYLETFFFMLKDRDFRPVVESSKGFCLDHFGDVLEYAEKKLPDSLADWFYPTVFGIMEKNMDRVKTDLDWFITKHDYRNHDASWKTSRDAVPRMMQKLCGGHPSDPPLKGK